MEYKDQDIYIHVQIDILLLSCNVFLCSEPVSPKEVI